MILPDTEMADDYMRALLAEPGPLQRAAASMIPQDNSAEVKAAETKAAETKAAAKAKEKESKADRESKETLAREKIESDERIAKERLAAEKAKPVEKPTDMAPVMEALAKGQEAIANALTLLAQAVASPREIAIKREQGKITGAKSTIN